MPAHRSQSCNNIAGITRNLVHSPEASTPTQNAAPGPMGLVAEHPSPISQAHSPSASSASSQRSAASSTTSPSLIPAHPRSLNSHSSPETSPGLRPLTLHPSSLPSSSPTLTAAAKSVLREPSSGAYWKNKKNRSVSWDDLPATLDGVSEEQEEQASEEQTRLSRSGSIESSDSDQKTNWQPDKEAKTCTLPGCGRKFSAVYRKHHCRQCGRVVCGQCSKGRIGSQRACNTCMKSRKSSICEDSEVSDDQYADRIPPVHEEMHEGQRDHPEEPRNTPSDLTSSGNGDLSAFTDAMKGISLQGTSVAGNNVSSNSGGMVRSSSAHAIIREERPTEPSPQKEDKSGYGYTSSQIIRPGSGQFMKKSSSSNGLRNMLGWSRFSGSEEQEVDQKVASSPRGGWISAFRGTGSRQKPVEEVIEEKEDSPIKAVYNGGLYIMDSRTPKPDPSSLKARQVLPIPNQEFVWSGTHSMDCQGLIYFLATGGGADRWVNPVESGIVKVTGTRWKLGQISAVVDTRPHCTSDSWSDTVEGAWFCIELPTGIALQPSHYSIRHGFGGGAQLRNWNLLASSDGENWTVLSQHTNDSSLVGGYAVHTWHINVEIESARMFKVVMTGGNDIQGFQLSCCGFELYGRVIAPLTEGILRPNHWLFAES